MSYPPTPPAMNPPKASNVVKISQMPPAPANIPARSFIVPVVYEKTNYSISLDRIVDLIDLSGINLGNIDNTSDLDKPISIATQVALDGKADKGHQHPMTEVIGLSARLTDIETSLAWKAATVHNHSASQIHDFAQEVGKLIPAPTVIAGAIQW